jgi:acylphosphatase
VAAREPAGEVVRIRAMVTGRVQGVGYRATCQWRAQNLGLAGWVRNLPDGRVEAVFEGRADAVDQMVAWYRRGPRGAMVEGVEVHAEEPAGERGFRVG